jgi:glutathione S-transferase
MTDFTIYLGNKNYSSWSLRGWLAMKLAGVPFEEVVIPLDQPRTRETILRYSPSGRLPALHHDGRVVWDSLAIAEYLADTFREARLWPADGAARAVARSVSAEMHSGFAELRRHMPMNMRSVFPGKGGGDGVQEQINRIAAIWRDCRRRFGGEAPFLFGDFTLADAMYAPVASRFVTYEVDLDETAEAYVKAVMAYPAMQEWLAAARNEPWIIPDYEF